MDSDKEAPTYGPWLLVSYGKQGNRSNKSRFGRNGNGYGNSSFMGGNGNAGVGISSRNSGNGNSGSGISGRSGGGNLARNGSGIPGNGATGSGTVGSFGKHAGNGNINSRRPEDVGKVNGKSDQLKSGANGKFSEGVKTPKSGKSTGSRFDILSEEGDVTMKEGSSQVSYKNEEGRKIKGKVVLSEVTNQRSIQGRKAKVSENSKLLANKGTKKCNPVIQASVAGEGVSNANIFSRVPDLRG
ncbi:hypothetical protein Q3G72_006323 [Acer saccharum]|nr:hypothetical protein Q3G72_006323 [Acer saccharum]